MAAFKIKLLLFLCLAPVAHGARILSVAFFSSRSHKITYEPLLYELASRGHDVTIVAPFISGKNRTNVREIQTVEWNEDKIGNVMERKLRGEALMNPFEVLDMLYDTCSQSYDLPRVRALLNEKFDLVFVSALMNECTAGFVYKLNTSIVLISAVSAPLNIASIFGNPNPTSFVPHLMTPYEDRMTFYQRTVNLLVDSLFTGFIFYYFQPKLAEMYREKLGDPTIPLHNEVIRNASLILSNSHLSLSKPRPFLPDIVEVGGMHCRPAKPLPKDLDEFLSGSGDHGFIFFSMGSILKASQMPENYRQIFIRTFARLKQRVLWKWETEQMDDLPQNVKLSNWLPQQDVLGHNKIRVFITHGGMGGTAEAAYHGVPLIGMPMMGDQATNLAKSERAGTAVVLDFMTLTEEDLYYAINRVLTTPSYRENAQKLSAIFRDQPDKPLDRAVFWTEYVIRHKGALHLRSAARDLNWIEYHSIDVVVTLITTALLVLYTIFAILRFIFRAICCRSTRKVKAIGRAKKSN